MKIHFKIQYHTFWGQRLLVSGNIPALGNGDYTKALSLGFAFPENWSGAVDVAAEELKNLQYKYILLNENTGQYTEEWDANRKLDVEVNGFGYIFCYDHWNAPNTLENTFLTAPFKEVLLKDEHPVTEVKIPVRYTHLLRVKAPLLNKNHVLCVVGDCRVLGNWSTQKPVLLNKQDDYWEVRLDLSKCQGEVHYKYGFYDAEDKHFCYFESGPDRVTYVMNDKKSMVMHHDGFVRMEGEKFRGAGVGLPVFSIRTKKSFGVGDFGDLKLLIDWAAKVGLKLIQVLPLNDTIGTHTDADVLPYAAITAFALNPLFLNLPAMGKLPVAHPLQKAYKQKQAELNAKELVEFLEVVNFKLEYAKELCKNQQGKFLKTKGFKIFFEENKYWLEPYAAFCVLRDLYGTPGLPAMERVCCF